jgi:hypothetical protein
MKIPALAPEQNRALLYWTTVDIRSNSVERSEAGILEAMPERPCRRASARLGSVTPRYGTRKAC